MGILAAKLLRTQRTLCLTICFLPPSPEQQDVIFQHEKGHIVCQLEKQLWHNIIMRLWKSGKIKSMPEEDFLYIYDMREAEADVFAATQVGIDKVVSVIKETIPWEAKTRIANIMHLKRIREF